MKKNVEEEVVYVDEDGNPIEIGEDDEFEYEEVEVEVPVEKTPGGLSIALNKVFHFIDRGGSLGSEIVAGITLALLTVCVAFVNIQVIGNMLTAGVTLANSPQNATNIEAAMTYATLYAGSVLVSILGTLAIGIVANLPLVQVSMMGLSGALLCLVETGTGLTVENLLFVNLIAGVIYAVLVLVPGVKGFVADAIPAGVRRALPGAVGLVFAWAALRQSGLLSPSTVSLGGGKTLDVISGVSLSTAGLGLATIAGVVVALALFIVLSVTKKAKPAFLSLIGGLLVFLLAGIATTGIDTASSDSIANFGRVWLVAGSQASATTPFADSYLTYFASAIPAVFSGIGDVISAGADFSAYSGTAVTAIVSGVLCYLFCGLLGAEGTVAAVAAECELDEAEADASLAKALPVNAATNIVGALFGAGAVEVSPVSFAAARDRARSGLASVVAAILMIVSLFVLIVPALFATSTYAVTSMNQWNYFAYGNGGFVYLVSAVSMAVADVVCACLGVAMFVGAIKGSKGVAEIAATVVMGIVAMLTLNIVAGVACGMLVYLVIALATKVEDVKIVPAAILEVLLIVAVVLL